MPKSIITETRIASLGEPLILVLRRNQYLTPDLTPASSNEVFVPLISSVSMNSNAFAFSSEYAFGHERCLITGKSNHGQEL